MSYYSDFKLSTNKEGYERFKSILRQLGEKDIKDYPSLKIRVQEGNIDVQESYIISAEYIDFNKVGYKGYEELTAVVNFVDECINEEEYPMSFARVGESVGDFETQNVYEDKNGNIFDDIIRVECITKIGEF